MDYLVDLTKDFQFASQDIKHVFDEMRIYLSSLFDAVSDIEQDGTSILNTDYANGYPFITPRTNDHANLRANMHDAICRKVFENAGTYSSRLTNFVITYNPFFLFELFDQLEHRKAYARRVLEARSEGDMHTAILSSIADLPSDKSDVVRVLSKQITLTESTNLASRLALYRDKIQDSSIKDIFQFVDKVDYFRKIEEGETFNLLLEDIDRFRRPSASADPYDAEMHRHIDVMMLLSTLGAQAGRSKYHLKYWGQDRLRRVFDNRMHELSRDSISPYLIQQAYMEVSNERELILEAKYNLSRRYHELNDILRDVIRFKDLHTLPITLAKACQWARNDFLTILSGRKSVASQDEYDTIMKDVSARKWPRAKEIFERAENDAATAEAIVKNLAATGIDSEARRVLFLRPNKRVAHLMNELGR